MTLGYRQLTPDNWTEADPVNRNFVRFSPLVGPISMSGNDWARAFLEVELSGHVPAEIVDLYGVARGSMLYGWFFYPLFRLGEEQLYRVIEAAARLRCQQLDTQGERPSFFRAIDLLIDAEVIAEEERERWTAARRLRNAAAHPERAAVIPPGAALGMLTRCARDIDGIFISA
jgi:hypothetical protein